MTARNKGQKGKTTYIITQRCLGLCCAGETIITFWRCSIPNCIELLGTRPGHSGFTCQPLQIADHFPEIIEAIKEYEKECKQEETKNG